MMATQVNLNADMAEGFGAYDIGDDAALMKIIRSASIACGFHAGDPHTMHRLVRRAKEEGVSIGAHPGFNDLWGFGRRRIDMQPDHLEYLVAYQIGALQAMAAYAGERVTHLKPHGALNNMAAENAELRDGHRPRHQGGRPRHHLRGAVRVRRCRRRPRSLACGSRAKASATVSTTMTAT